MNEGQDSTLREITERTSLFVPSIRKKTKTERHLHEIRERLFSPSPVIDGIFVWRFKLYSSQAHDTFARLSSWLWELGA
jgi:methyl coenzyme M reductase subunit C-like uncharacterized protein (methanogenesis marker protein 7)